MKDRLINIALNMPLAPADQDLHRDPSVVAHMLNQIQHYPCIALPSIDDPVLLCGVVHQLGMGEAWMLCGEAFLTRWKEAYLIHKQIAGSIYRSLNLHRMHMLVDPARADACRYAQKVGFEFEFTAARFSAHGSDMSFYVWPHQERKSDV